MPSLELKTVVATVLAGLTAAPAVLAASEDSRAPEISGAGFGAVEIGMTEAQAERASGYSLVGSDPDPGCRYLRPADRSVPVWFMLTKNRIVRVDVSHRKFTTTSGVRVGDREADVRRRLAGRLKVDPHKYFPAGSYLWVRPLQGNRRVVIETDGTKVTSIRAGRLPEASWVEGCG